MPESTPTAYAWYPRENAFTGALTLMCPTADYIDLLLPPGCPVSSEWFEAGEAGEGLWTQARWSRTDCDPALDCEPPERARFLRTVHVLQIVDVELHDTVEDMLRLQVEQVRLLTMPVPGQLMSDRRARLGAELLLAIEDEAREAFGHRPAWLLPPAEEADAVDVPNSYEEFLLRVPAPTRRGGAARAQRDRELRLRELLILVFKALLGKLLRSRPLMASDLVHRRTGADTPDVPEAPPAAIPAA